MWPLALPFSPVVAMRENNRYPRIGEHPPGTIADLRSGLLMFERLNNANTLRRFVRMMQQAGFSTSSKNNYLRRVKIWLQWLTEEGGYGLDAAPSGEAAGGAQFAAVDRLSPGWAGEHLSGATASPPRCATLVGSCGDRAFRGAV